MNRVIAISLTLLLLISTVGIPDLHAQIDSLHINLEEAWADTVAADSTLADTAAAEPVIEIVPWKYNHAITAAMTTNDSLLRWQNWPDWTFKRNRDPGVLSFRLGTVGRSSALVIDAHEPRHQQLLWEDIPMHNRVSGTVNWNVLPIHKVESIYEESGGITHNSNFYLKNYYVNKPRSRLIFDESKFNRRSLEFWVTQNFTSKTNAEISYWDRRGGGGYANSSYTGNQIFARVYHQYDNRQFFKLRFLNGSRNLGEPFGYNIPNLTNFAFNHFDATANQPNAKSETGLMTLALSYHRRPADSTSVPERLRGGLFVNNQKRQVTYSADSTFHKVRSIGAFAHKWIEWNPFRVEGLVRYELFSNEDPAQSSLEKKNWSQLTAKGTASFEPVSWAKVKGNASFKQRGEHSSYSVGGDIEFNIADRLQVSAGASRGIKMPTLQQLYWNSAEYSGSAELEPEKILEAHGSVGFRIIEGLNLGAKGQLKQIGDGVFLNSQNQFVNIQEYKSASATGYIDFESTHFELSTSGTVQQYSNALPAPATDVPAFNTRRIWLKGGGYWKGYLFNRATYVKAGLSGMFSPTGYRAEHYYTALDYWQSASSDQALPWYSRLDVDLSARVRSIMVVVRFENVLDEVNQLGYFEAANYPMPSRRFLFGIRAMFEN